MTKCNVQMEFIDTTALSDVAESTSDNISQANITKLSDKVSFIDYASTELNQFVLDGTKEIMPNSPSNIAFWSDRISGADGMFDTPLIITLDFDNPHTSNGVTFIFVGDYPQTVKVTYFDLADNVIIAHDCYPTSNNFFCEGQVVGYGKIVLEITGTTYPFSAVKIQEVVYGQYINWNSDKIKSAKVVEEIDETSATVSINTANLSIVDTNGDFDISNRDGLWKSIQSGQEVTLTETKDGVTIPCGVFYIDTWNSSKGVVNFTLIDTIGLIDKTTFYDGEIYVNKTAKYIIDKIMLSAGISDYTVSSDVQSIVLNGYLGIMSHRKALQQVIFACGAVVDDSRGSTIRIYKSGRTITNVVESNRKFLGSQITMDDYVSDISIGYKTYTVKASTETIFSGTLSVGQNKIEFGAPYTNLSVSSGTIVSSSANYIIVNMTTAGTCTITGKGYTETSLTYAKSLVVLESGQSKNTKTYNGCTLVSYDRAQIISDFILNYYQLRQIVKMRYICNTEKVGEWLSVQNGNEYMATGVTKQTLDLTGGFIAEIESRGYNKDVTEQFYTGLELYTGEEIGLL